MRLGCGWIISHLPLHSYFYPTCFVLISSFSLASLQFMVSQRAQKCSTYLFLDPEFFILSKRDQSWSLRIYRSVLQSSIPQVRYSLYPLVLQRFCVLKLELFSNFIENIMSHFYSQLHFDWFKGSTQGSIAFILFLSGKSVFISELKYFIKSQTCLFQAVSYQIKICGIFLVLSFLFFSRPSVVIFYLILFISVLFSLRFYIVIYLRAQGGGEEQKDKDKPAPN